MSKILLLISARPDDQIFAAEVAAAAELTLNTVTDPHEAASIIANQHVSAIFADTSSEKQYQALELAIQETVGLFSDKINANTIYFLSSEDLEKVQYLIQSPLFGHFLLRNYGDAKSAGTHYGRLVKSSITQNHAFGVQHLLAPNAKVQVVKLQEAVQKQEAVEAVRNYLLAAKFQTRMATVISNAVDELLMNAIFDAPIDDLGRPLLATTPRTSNLKLQGKHAVEMHIGYDGTHVAVSAVDLFGSLDKTKLLSHISKIYTEEEYKVKATSAGAGIGLATVFRSGGSFFFVSESRAKTEVTVLFRRCESFREFKDQFRFISTQFYF